MRLFKVCLMAALAASSIEPSLCWAGMPSARLSDVAAWRLSTISFFVFGFCLAVLAVHGCWNRLARDFAQLPRLSLVRAGLLVFCWGCGFVLILTMISGARELMTPGAWEPAGATYQLRASDSRRANTSADASRSSTSARAPRETGLTTPAAFLTQRLNQIRQLGAALENYAADHAGVFPATLQSAGADAALAHLPDLPGMNYVYVVANTCPPPGAPLVFEPNVYGDDCWVYLSGGMIKLMPLDQIQALATDSRVEASTHAPANTADVNSTDLAPAPTPGAIQTRE